jgi:hypothetical protein
MQGKGIPPTTFRLVERSATELPLAYTNPPLPQVGILPDGVRPRSQARQQLVQFSLFRVYFIGASNTTLLPETSRSQAMYYATWEAAFRRLSTP